MFSNLKALTIPEGDVTKVLCGSTVLWEKPPAYKNWVEYAEDTAAGSLYNGCGYKENVRLSSSGSVSGSAQSGSVTTGFMPFKNTDVIRMKGAEWVGASDKYGGHYYFNLYNSSKGNISSGIMASSSMGGANASSQFNAVYDSTTGVTTFSIVNPTGNTGQFREAAKTAAWFRINAYGKGKDLIITINEEIK